MQASPVELGVPLKPHDACCFLALDFDLVLIHTERPQACTCVCALEFGTRRHLRLAGTLALKVVQCVAAPAVVLPCRHAGRAGQAAEGKADRRVNKTAHNWLLTHTSGSGTHTAR